MGTRSTRTGGIATALSMVLVIFCLAGGAFAADRVDRSFGGQGVAEVPLPAEARESGVAPGVWDLAAAPGGKMVASVGDFLEFGYFAVARFHADGILDTSFGTDGFTKDLDLGTPQVGPQAQGLVVQKDGRTVVVGYRENDRGAAAPVLVRYLPDGTLDRSFGHRGKVAPKPPFEGGDVLHDVAIQPAGRIIAVGARNEVTGGPPAGFVIAYRTDGRIDRSFGHRGRVFFPSRRDHQYTALRAVQVLASGKVVVAGYRRGHLFLARVTRAGDPDRDFGGGDGRVSLRIETGDSIYCCPQEASLALQRDGRILVQGEALSRNQLALARFGVDGTLDRSFGRGGLVAHSAARGLPYPHDIAVQGDGKIVAVGSGPRIGPGEPRVGTVLTVLRYLPDGRLDRGFGDGGRQTLPVGEHAAALAALAQPTGRVVVAGASEASRTSRETILLLTRYLAG